VRTLWYKLWATLTRSRRDEDLSEEVRFHLEQLAEEYAAAGMSCKQAELAARREFGGAEQIKETYRDRRGFAVLDNLLRDVRFARRSLAKSPGFVVVVVLTLALGIGVNTAIFSVAHKVVLSPAPYPVERPQDVYVLEETYGSETGVAYLDFRDWQDRVKSFDILAAFRPSSGNITNVDEPFRVDVLMTTWDYFSLMGVQPHLGRFFTPEKISRQVRLPRS
jgi:putative ABC transport system permease protein